MQLLEVLALRGPNVWARFPVLEAQLQLDQTDARAIQAIPGAVDRLWSWLSPLRDGRETLLDPQAWDRELKAAKTQPEALQFLALAFQQLARAHVSRGWVQASRPASNATPEGTRNASANPPSQVFLAVEYEEEKLGRDCLDAALQACRAAVGDQPFNAEASVQALRSTSNSVLLGPSTRAIVLGAQARGIPTRRLNNGSLVQLGHGAKQRLAWTAQTDRTSAIGQSIASDKNLTKERLRIVGVPVPEGRGADSAEDAWSAACEIGLPVVVKPCDANHGRGVSINLATREQVLAAYSIAETEGSGVLVERLATGAEHRLLVVGNRLVAATRGEPDEIVGDGRQTVEQLVDELNRDPRRGGGWRGQLSHIGLGPLADLTLAQQGCTRQSIPPAGAHVVLHHNGDYTIDETDEVHPAVAAAAVAAAAAVGLDIAGLDLIADDISRPLESQGGVVLEVNAGPSLSMHLEPQHGKPRPVGEAIVEMMFPSGQSGRIPVVAVSGNSAGSGVAALIAHLLGQTGQRVGLDTAQGTFDGSRRSRRAGLCNNTTAANLLSNPFIEAAVVEVSPQSIVREGLGFDHCSLAVLTGIGNDAGSGKAAIGNSGDSAASAGEALRVVVEALLHEPSTPRGNGVVANADDLQLASLPLASGALLYGTSTDNPALAATIKSGSRAVFQQNGSIVFADAGKVQVIVPLNELPTQIAKSQTQICDVLAAVAAAIAMQIPIEAIQAGMRTFAQ